VGSAGASTPPPPPRSPPPSAPHPTWTSPRRRRRLALRCSSGWSPRSSWATSTSSGSFITDITRRRTYATRRALVEQAVRSFYGILWNRHHPSHAVVQLDTLSGQRAERAVVHVHTSHWCATEQGLAPALPAKARGGSMLVFHPDAVAARRDALVKYLAATVSPPVDRADLGGRVRTLGDGQAALTEKSLAGMLRSYTLMVK
jgi:hypothetical protein